MHPFSVGKDISARDREEQGISDELLHAHTSYTYGETPLEAVANALTNIKTKHGGLPQNGVFLDVGCGTGKPMFAAALLHSWAKVLGVEFLEGLVDAAMDVQEVWEGGLPFVAKGVKGTQYRIPLSARQTPIEFIFGDACKPGVVDWSKVDVAYACSTCFDDATMAGLGVVSKAMAPGSVFVTSGVQLPTVGSDWDVVDEIPSTMSWGEATVYIHKRVSS